MIYFYFVNGRKSSNYNTNFTTISNLISFTITDKNGSVTTYCAEEGMTWQEWIESIYNTDNFYMSEKGVCTNGHGLYDVYYTDVMKDGVNIRVCAPF